MADGNLKRMALIGAGTFFVALGIVGILLPLLPTTPFLLLAAACYMRSSRRFYDWLLGSRYLGDYIRNYREGKGITPKAKIFTVSLLWLTIGYSAGFTISTLGIRILLVLIALGVTAHVLLIKTFRK